MDHNNFLVIMAGGAGTRFWPQSREAHPKQFLDFFGTGRTLLQQTFDRFSGIVPAENVYIASNVQYRDVILEQLPMLQPHQLLLEPARRNTAPCIAYAMNKIRALNRDAKVVITPSDHLILKEQEFRDTINRGLEFVAKNDALLTLGIRPTRPETGYGYIQMGTEREDVNGVFDVKTFTEKPNIEIAKVFLESGEFLWNSGMFLWSVEAITKAFEKYEMELWLKFAAGKASFNTPEEQTYIDSIYRTCKNLSIDYAIMEKAQNVSVIAADFGWSDLGTWGSLYELADKSEERNAVLKGEAILHNASGNVISLSEGKMAVIEGIDDCIVVDNDDVLLICKREDEQHIRDYVGEVKDRFGKKYI